MQSRTPRVIVTIRKYRGRDPRQQELFDGFFIRRLRPWIERAIREKRTLMLNYDGFRRLLNPHVLYLTADGRLVVVGEQTTGGSRWAAMPKRTAGGAGSSDGSDPDAADAGKHGGPGRQLLLPSLQSPGELPPEPAEEPIEPFVFPEGEVQGVFSFLLARIVSASVLDLTFTPNPAAIPKDPANIPGRILGVVA